MRRLPLLAVAGLLCAACVIGSQIANFEPANVPGGSHILVKTKIMPTGYAGELLAMEDSTLLLVQSDTLLRVPIRLIRSVDARYGGGPGIADHVQREKLRLVSRYPGGMTPELERRLLEAYHQPSIRLVQ